MKPTVVRPEARLLAALLALSEALGLWLLFISIRAMFGYPELLHLTVRVPPGVGLVLGLGLLAGRMPLGAPRARAGASVAAALALALIASRDAASYWQLELDGLALPASLGMVVLTLAVAVATGQAGAVGRRPSRRALAVACAAAVPVVPLVEMTTFGLSDYRRPADVAVVFGARVYASGRLSDAARDRVTEAARCYAQGLVDTLVLSGGPGDGHVSEPEAMAREAARLGVPREALLLDETGLSTRATLENLAALAPTHGWRRVLAVSHFYHLSRIKLECGRAGLECYTVPAAQPRPLPGLPWFMAREVVGWWRAALLVP